MKALGLDRVEDFGAGLDRPECVHCTAQGDVFVSDWRGGVLRIRPDGTQQLYRGLIDGRRPVKTNGFAILPDRSFLLAHLDDREGGVWRLTLEGELTPWLEGLPPTNFVHVHGEKTYVTVSTRLVPRTLARRPGCADGFILLRDQQGTRIVAEGLGFTNECKADPGGTWLYVNETFGKRLVRFRITKDGLGDRETFAEFGHGVFPDGLDFDAEGGLWITSIFSNRLIRVAPDGRQTVVLEDNDPAFVDRMEALFASGELARAGTPEVPAQRIRNLSSSAFGGPDLRTLYLGCLQDSRIYRMPAPVAGAKPPHWDVRFP
ncbi:MAG TPA: SMP-30/gluconolactonase/LRE family protein [Burkholderiales bacterium]|nr:SMP-30/gluconolactonase/LRE family protein [Burkholderiales bacterium]